MKKYNQFFAFDIRIPNGEYHIGTPIYYRNKKIGKVFKTVQIDRGTIRCFVELIRPLKNDFLKEQCIYLDNFSVGYEKENKNDK